MFEATRYARGHKALYTLEINGEHASAFWDLHDLHRIQYFDHRDEGRLRGWRSIHVTDGDQPYMKHWWVPGLQIGYEHTFIHQFADFAAAAAEGKPLAPTFRDALQTDYVTDAILASAKNGTWQTVGGGRTATGGERVHRFRVQGGFRVQRDVGSGFSARATRPPAPRAPTADARPPDP